MYNLIFEKVQYVQRLTCCILSFGYEVVSYSRYYKNWVLIIFVLTSATLCNTIILSHSTNALGPKENQLLVLSGSSIMVVSSVGLNWRYCSLTKSWKKKILICKRF